MGNVASLGPFDANQAEFLEWHDVEGIGPAEEEILERIGTMGLYAVSNALHKAGFRTALSVEITILEAAFQLGRAIGIRDAANSNLEFGQRLRFGPNVEADDDEGKEQGDVGSK